MRSFLATGVAIALAIAGCARNTHDVTVAALSATSGSPGQGASGSGQGSNGASLSDSGSNGANPQILSAVAGPAASLDYFHRTTTVLLTASDFAGDGDTVASTNCSGPGGDTLDPKPLVMSSEVPASDGSGHVVMTVELAIPLSQTECNLIVTRNDGVVAPAVQFSPFWLALPTFTFDLEGISGGNNSLPSGSVGTLQFSGAPASTTVWLGWYWSATASAGGQAAFAQVATDTTTTDGSGSLSYAFGGPSDVRSNKHGGYYLIFVIGNQMGEIYWPC